MLILREYGVAQTLEILREIAPLSPAVLSRKRLAVVLGYGNLGRGAVAELIRQGVEQIIVFTQRHPITIENKFAGVDYIQGYLLPVMLVVVWRLPSKFWVKISARCPNLLSQPELCGTFSF